MAHETQQPNEPATEDDLRQEDSDWAGRDYQLTHFVRAANSGGMTLGITLAVSGTIVTGVLTSRSKWRDELGQTMRQGFEAGVLSQLDEEYPDDLADRFVASMIGHEEELVDPDEDQNTTILELPRFIHLSNAYYVTPSGFVPATKNMLWRGKLSSVDGWSHGTIA